MGLLRFAADMFGTVLILPYLFFLASPSLGVILACLIWLPLVILLIPVSTLSLAIAIPTFLFMLSVSVAMWIFTFLSAIVLEPFRKFIQVYLPCLDAANDEEFRDDMSIRRRSRSRSSSALSRPTTPLTPGRRDSTQWGYSSYASSGMRDDDDALFMAKRPSFVSNPAALPPHPNTQSLAPDLAEARSRRSSFIRSPEEASKIYTQTRPKLSSSSNSFYLIMPRSGPQTPTQERQDRRRSMSFSDGSRPGEDPSSHGNSLGAPSTSSPTSYRSELHGSVNSSVPISSRSRSQRSSIGHYANSSTTSLNSLVWARSEKGKDHGYDSDLANREEGEDS